MKMILRNMKFAMVCMAVSLLATSCLEKNPESALPENEALKSYDDAEQFLTGIYANMMNSALWSGYLTILPDLQADMVYAIDGYSNTHGDIWQWNIRSTNAEVSSVYSSLYMVIANCNYFLENIDAVIGKQTDDSAVEYLNYYKGEVYAIRALCYSELIKNFCKAYDPATAANELGVVIRTRYSVSESSRRASLADSYRFVVEDLKRAEELLDPENDYYSSDYMTHAVACALHARIALYMHDWETAIAYSTKLIENKNFALSSATTAYTSTHSYFTYMWDYDLATEIIWRLGFTTTSYGGALGARFLGFTNDYYYYYPDYVPAQWVLNLYGTNDLRYNAYFASLQTGYDHALTWPLLIKYYGNRNFISSYIYHVSMPKPFRLAEQYLIRAEAYCRQASPNYSLAAKDITTLRTARYATGGGISLTADNCIQQIAEERVRELYMEGFRLHDLKRWGKLYNNGAGFQRTPQQSSLSEGSSLKVTMDNPLFTWPIPQHELEAPGSEVEPNESNM